MAARRGKNGSYRSCRGNGCFQPFNGILILASLHNSGVSGARVRTQPLIFQMQRQVIHRLQVNGIQMDGSIPSTAAIQMDGSESGQFLLRQLLPLQPARSMAATSSAVSAGAAGAAPGKETTNQFRQLIMEVVGSSSTDQALIPCPASTSFQCIPSASGVCPSSPASRIAEMYCISSPTRAHFVAFFFEPFCYS